MITGRRFEVPRFLQNALDATPVELELAWVYESLLRTVTTMDGYYDRDELQGRWDRFMEDNFLIAWETNFYELYIDQCFDDSDKQGATAAEEHWKEFQAFTQSFLGRDADRHGLERLWRSFDRILAPYNIICPYCLEEPKPTKDWFYVADSEEI